MSTDSTCRISSFGKVIYFATMALSSCLMMSAGTFGADLPNRPNVVVVVADDMGYGDLPANNPSSLLKLPNLERLARDGIRFTDAHSPGALCAPSRYSLVTGNYSYRGRQEMGIGKYYGYGSQILPNQLTIGDMAKSLDYETAFIGKVHLGGNVYLTGTDDFAAPNDSELDLDFSRRFVDGPRDHGFDYSFVLHRSLSASPYAYFKNSFLVGDPADLIIWQPGTYGDSVIRSGGIGVPTWNTTEVGETYLNEVLSFIRANASSGPFFVHYTTSSAHQPETPPLDLNGIPIRDTSGIGPRGDMIVEIDVTVGEVIRELEDLNILQDTIIIFMSDNGPRRIVAERDLGHDSCGGFAGKKGSYLECGHRVPMIIHWGDGTDEGSYIAPGMVSDQLVGGQDIVATLAGIIGVDFAEDQLLDGLSLLPVLFEDQIFPDSQRDHVLTITRDTAIPSGSWYYALRKENLKLVVVYEGSSGSATPIALFDLAADPHEETNLIDNVKFSATLASMTMAFMELRASERSIFDRDFDGIQDQLDNCTDASNSNQLDSNGDGFGNICDADINDDLFVDFLDLALIAEAFYADAMSPNWNPDADLDGDGQVNFVDLGFMSSAFLGKPGPSGIAP